MVCKFCGKPLPVIPQDKCPHCFAEWMPESQEDNKTSKAEEASALEHDFFKR